MTTPSLPTRASEWLLALSEAPGDTRLLAAFRAWLAASPDHARDWEEMERTYRLMGLTVPAFRTRWAPPAPPPPPAARRAAVPVRRRVVAGVTALAAGLALMVASGLPLRLSADAVTATAETRALRLDDGSTVHLAPQSAVAVALSAGERRVRLLQGEAFFDVAPDPNRPFVVTAGAVETTVLGTAFDVRMLGDETWVGVQRGRVRVDDTLGTPPVSETLEAGDWVSLGPEHSRARGQQPPAQMAAWTQGDLIARDTPVAAVLDAIRPYFPGFIIVRGDTLARQPLTGVYRLSDPAEAVRAIAETQGASVRRLSPWLLVVEGR